MTTNYSQLHSPKISCIQSVYNLTFYNRKWTFTTHKSHIEHKRNGLGGYVIIYLSEEEILKAEDYLHIHVIPDDNKDLLDKKYRVSGKGMEDTWRGMLKDQSKYVVVDPKRLFMPIVAKYPELTSYLERRYW